MATNDGKYTHGAIGRVVYRKYRDKQVIQERPVGSEFRLTKATKKAANLFGIASNLACAFRDNMEDTIGGLQDGTMVSRFNSEVLFAVRQAHDPETMTYQFTNYSFERMSGFEFNMNSPLRNYFFIQPEVLIIGKDLKITLPKFSMPSAIKLPKDARNFTISVSLSMYDLIHGKQNHTVVQSLFVKDAFLPKEVDSKEFDYKLESGCVCIISISLKYEESTFSGTRSVNSKNCNPSAILKAFISEGETSKDLQWRDIPNLKLLKKVAAVKS